MSVSLSVSVPSSPLNPLSLGSTATLASLGLKIKVMGKGSRSDAKNCPADIRARLAKCCKFQKYDHDSVSFTQRSISLEQFSITDKLWFRQAFKIVLSSMKLVHLSQISLSLEVTVNF